MQATAFNFLTDDQARQLIREELEKLFQDISPIINQGVQQCNVVDLNGLLEARPIIGKRSTINKKIQHGIIPHSKQGKKVYFDLNEIDKWLLSNKIKTVEELEKEARDYLKNKRR